MSEKVYFEIQADDVKRAANFYTTIFGWEIKKEERIPIEYWRINTSYGAILQRPMKTPPQGHGTNAFVCSFEVLNFDEIAEKIVGLGGIVAMDKFAVPEVCWQGYFQDTEGNTFGIFQPDPSAK